MENCTFTSVELFNKLDKKLGGFREWTDGETYQIEKIIGCRAKKSPERWEIGEVVYRNSLKLPSG
jgi:hypothetical protein